MKLNLLQNGMHSLYQALQVIQQSAPEDSSDRTFDHEDHSISWQTQAGTYSFYIGNHYTPPSGSYRYKFVIIHLIHAVEMFLKEEVISRSETLLFRKGSTTKTISLVEALKLVESWHPNILSQDERILLIQAKDIRNKLEHYKFDGEGKNLKELARQLALVLMCLAYKLFNVKLIEFFSFDPWTDTDASIANVLKDFVSGKGVFIDSIVSAIQSRHPNEIFLTCTNCFSKACPISSKNCELCGEEIDRELAETIFFLEKYKELEDKYGNKIVNFKEQSKI